MAAENTFITLFLRNSQTWSLLEIFRFFLKDGNKKRWQQIFVHVRCLQQIWYISDRAHMTQKNQTKMRDTKKIVQIDSHEDANIVNNILKV